jgi:2-polyprenyl-3-methyl-5-hydroxy-6-metoxy-1,4-benzoquinol methylase
MPRAAACLACGCFARARRFTLAEPWRIDECSSCGMHTLEPRPDEVVLEEFNSGEGYEGAFDLETEMLEASRRTLRTLEHHAPGRRLLDVGSGPGFLLRAARERGWDAVALDPSPFAVAQARKAGFEAHQGMLEDVPLEAASFDALALLQVIEHVTDPRPLLAACHRLLKPGGALVVATPNPASLLADTKREGFNYWIPPVHCVWYPPAALTMILERNGFRVAHAETWSARTDAIHDGVDALRHTRFGDLVPMRWHRRVGDLVARAADRVGKGSIVEQVAIKEAS